MPTNELHNMYGHARLDDRQATELTGVCRGLIADGVVNEKEAVFLRTWLAANVGITGNPVIGDLLRRITGLLEARALHAEDTQALFHTLESFTGNDMELGEPLKSTTLPFDKPAPELGFGGQRYCFTGTFVFGGRGECEAAVHRLGGECGSLTLKTNYLVVGAYASESWAHSSYGRKIERAVELKRQGHPIFIVGEEHWAACLKRI
jgi:NAD-dependent DNA ligase